MPEVKGKPAVRLDLTGFPLMTCYGFDAEKLKRSINQKLKERKVQHVSKQ